MNEGWMLGMIVSSRISVPWIALERIRSYNILKNKPKDSKFTLERLWSQA